jgi:TonB family protein
LTRISPKYPLTVRRRLVTGCVPCRATVAADGHGENAVVTKPLDDELDADATATIRKWRYSPARVNGFPRRALFNVEVCYDLH